MKKYILLLTLLSTFSISGIKYYETHTVNGQYYSKRNVESLRSCAYLCDTERKCKAFNYRVAKSECTLLDSYSSFMKVNGITSGLKVKGKKVTLAKPKKVIKEKPMFKIEEPKQEKKKEVKPKPKMKEVVPTPIIVKTPEVIAPTVAATTSSPSFFESFSTGLTSIGNSISETFTSTNKPTPKKEVKAENRVDPYQNQYDEVEEEEYSTLTMDETEIITEGDVFNSVQEDKKEIVFEEVTFEEKKVTDLSEEEQTTIINKFVYAEETSQNQNEFKPSVQAGYCNLMNRKTKKKIAANNCTLKKYILKDMKKYRISFNGGVDLFFEEDGYGEITYISFEDGLRYPAKLDLFREEATFDKYSLKYHIF